MTARVVSAVVLAGCAGPAPAPRTEPVSASPPAISDGRYAGSCVEDVARGWTRQAEVVLASGRFRLLTTYDGNASASPDRHEGTYTIEGSTLTFALDSGESLAATIGSMYLDLAVWGCPLRLQPTQTPLFPWLER